MVPNKAMSPADSLLSARRTTLRFIRTLLWKNWVLKKRHLVTTVAEMVVPMLFVLLLSALKHLTTDVNVPAGWSDDTKSPTDKTIGTSFNLFQPSGSSNEWVEAALPKFAQTESSLTGLILAMGLQSINDAIRVDELSASDLATCTAGVTISGLVDVNTSAANPVPTACGNHVAPYKIAIAPDTLFTREYFLQTMDAWYPRIDLLNSSESVQIPSFRESVKFFDTDAALEEYVKSDNYGKGLSTPRIYGAIVFDSYPSDSDIGSFTSMEYSIRLNSTAGDSIGRVPSTSGDPNAVYSFQKDIATDYYTSYTITGFATLQTLVTRFVSCMPEWDSSSQSTTGVCQRELSTAQATSEVDERLFNSLSNDSLIQGYLNTIATYSGSNASISSFSSLSAQLSDETKEMLLTPLRQAPQPYLGSIVAPFPVEDYVDAPFYSSIKQVFGIVFVLSYLFIVSRILVIFIQEKESRMREFMKILGVKEKAIIASWYIMYLVILFIGAVLQALAGMVGVFTNSSPIVTFLFFYLFSISVLAFAFLISTLFSKARVGSFVGMVLFFVMYFVSVGFNEQTDESTKNTVSILSPVALTFAVTVFSDAEATGEGVTFGNIDNLSSNYRISTALLMFIIDSAVYTLLGLYFEKVIPKEYGTTLKWYFPVSPSYWRNRRHGGVNTTQGPLLDDVVLDVNPNFEPVNADLREQERRGEMLSVQRLRKVFQVPGGEKVAVNGVNLAMYKNQITCLLGHNGAGKSTLISMLTGMTAPSSGNATYQGMSINEDMEEMRESLGICFQHDVLFSDMTVEEHLIFFGRIKGYTDVELRAVVDTQIREVGLTEKRHVKSGELSGGMKRKLSVAVCLLGDSSLVFLDEPTSGMDPYSRRSTWEILLNNRNDRVMVLTTHFMDEADILGDRIAIMSEGEVRCCGSSLFLKNRFGAGYNLTLVKDDERCKENDVVSFVTSFVPSAQLLSNVGSEIAFQLPIDSSSHFAAMFAKMDDQMSRLGLLSYGVSVTTLEEVFIKVAEANDEGNQHTLSKEARHVTPASSPASSTATSDSVIRQQAAFGVHLKALLLKRFRYAKRDKKMLFYSTAMPIFLLIAGLGLMKGSSISSDDPSLPLTTVDYTGDSTPTPYFCQADANDWCSTIMDNSVFSGASLQELTISDPAYSSSSPTVFNVTYDNPTINASDATGYFVALGEESYKRGYGVDQEAVNGQFGAYLVYGDSDSNLLGYNIFANTTGTHSSVIFKALMDQAIYRFFASNASTSASATVDLKVNNYPLPLTAAAKAFFTSILAFAASELICIAFTFFPASVVVFLVKEKEASHNSKHQQLVSGVSLGAFWLANYIWDLILYLVPCIAGLVLIQVFSISTMTGSSDCTSCTSETFPAVILLFVLFGFAVCPFTYCLSYLFKEHASSQSYTIMINFMIGVVLMIVSFILDLVSDSTEDVNSVLKFIWRLSPLFNLGNGLLSLVLNEFKVVLSSSDEKTSPFSTDIMGFELLYLFFTSILYFGLAIGIDYALTFPKIKDAMTHHDGGDDEHVELDSDVVKEAERVARGDADNDVVKLANLRKVYPGGKVAVRDLSFGLKRGECFGFLGINGAGKTTTMKMLTGDELPTHGGATLSGFDILTQQIEVRRQIGYCPQFDALFDLLTVREHLELFASIKGASGAELASVVDEKIEQLNLADFENKLAGSLSGGNKRKLSVAIAMIGNPRIIFLDEPSTGMDPVSRRFMWDVIAGISTRGKSSTIVLTTHSMEEAEALCSRVGIMVGGRMRCLGSVQHLKGRFGDGLVFDVKLNMPTPDELEYLVQEVFGTTDGVVTPADLEAKCHAFGNHHLAERVVASHPTGYGMAAAMERDGFIRAEAFCSWCVEETRFDALHAFLINAFGNGGALVMERQNDFCRFKLRGSSEQLKLSTVFALIEEAKASLDIREYSVSQTTLEQIFNGFASQQQEEQGVARGVFRDD